MMDVGDTWACAVASDNGRPVLLRCRTNLAGVVGCESHQQLLRIVWRYDVTDATGLPPPELNDRMAALETALFGDLEQDFLGMFVWVRVSDGVKEWAAYIADAQRTCDRLNVALESHDPYPIELTVDDDPTWEVYTRFLDTVASASG